MEVQFLTEVVEAVAGPVERTSVELEADDGENYNREEQQQRDVDQGTDRLSDRTHHNLETCKQEV